MTTPNSHDSSGGGSNPGTFSREPIESDAFSDESRTVPIPFPGTECLEIPDGVSAPFLLKNSVTHAYLRIDEKDRFLWEQIDGQATLGEIAHKYFDVYKSLGFERIGKLYRQLRENRFVETERESTIFRPADKTENADSFGGLRDALRRLAFRPLGPSVGDRFFQSLDSVGFSFLGSRAVLKFLAFAGLAGLAVFVHSILFHRVGAVYHFVRPGGYYSLALLAFYFWNVIGSFVYELHRAAALKASGCEVIKAGLALRFGVLGATVDIKDFLTVSRKQRTGILLSGIAAELYLLGICGVLATLDMPLVARELLALGAIVIAFRLFLHLCPFFDSSACAAISGTYGVRRLRHASLRFFRPANWAALWSKQKWAPREKLYFFYGLWCAAWVILLVQISSFVLNSQIRLAILDLLSRGFSGRLQSSLDEAVAIFIILIVFIPFLTFLVLSIVYVSASFYHALPTLKIWARPRNLVACLFLVSLGCGWLILASAQSDRQLQLIFMLSLVVLALARSLYRKTRLHLGDLKGNRIRRLFNLMTIAVLPGFLGLLVTSAEIQSGFWAIGAAAAAALLCLPQATGLLLPRIGSLLRLPWVSLFVGLAAFAVSSFVAFGLTKTNLVATSSGITENDWTALMAASGILALGSARAWWFLIEHYQPILPRYAYSAETRSPQLLALGFCYVATALRRNLQILGTSAAVSALDHRIQLGLDNAELEVRIDEGRIVVSIPDDAGDTLGFEEIAGPLRDAVLDILALAEDMTGTEAVLKIVHAIHKTMPWEERQLVNQHLYQGTHWQSPVAEANTLSKQERTDLLKETFLFHQFTSEELQGVASVISSRCYEQHQTIIQQGEQGDEAYVLLKGRVEVLAENDLGEKQVLAVLGPSDFFGELALLEDAPRSATVQAITDVELLVLDRPVFESFVERFGSARETLANCIQALRTIQNMPLFDDFSAEDTATIAIKFRIERFEPGAEIIRQGEGGDKFYVIQDGRAEVRRNENAETRTVGTLESGDYFGEIALLHDVPRTATVAAITPLTVFSLTRANFVDLVGGNPFAAGKLEKESERRTHQLGSNAPA